MRKSLFSTAIIVIALLSAACQKENTPDRKEGALSGVFTVNASGAKVYFSKGNLYYTGSAFQFEANQYDFRHYNGKTGDKAVINGISTTTPSGTVGSFFWSKTVSVAYAGTYSDASAASTDVLFTNNTVDTPKEDFTCNGATGVWRTLSGGDNGEWRYLLTKRTVNGGTGEGKSYQRATIRSDISGGIFGMIIYPDDYTSQTTAESYTSSEWTTMENAGCVFIPAAGYRDDTVVDQVNDYGRYLSSTASGAGTSYYLRFCSDDLIYSYDYSNDYGRSVRLVTSAQ